MPSNLPLERSELGLYTDPFEKDGSNFNFCRRSDYRVASMRGWLLWYQQSKVYQCLSPGAVSCVRNKIRDLPVWSFRKIIWDSPRREPANRSLMSSWFIIQSTDRATPRLLHLTLLGGERSSLLYDLDTTIPLCSNTEDGKRSFRRWITDT